MRHEIKGGNLPAVICYLEANETLVCQSGAMSWMSPNMKMETLTNGGAKKAFGRLFSGESMFQNNYTAQGKSGMIALSSHFPGSIVAFRVGAGNEVIAQKTAFLAAVLCLWR